MCTSYRCPSTFLPESAGAKSFPSSSCAISWVARPLAAFSKGHGHSDLFQTWQPTLATPVLYLANVCNFNSPSRSDNALLCKGLGPCEFLVLYVLPPIWMLRHTFKEPTPLPSANTCQHLQTALLLPWQCLPFEVLGEGTIRDNGLGALGRLLQNTIGSAITGATCAWTQHGNLFTKHWAWNQPGGQRLCYFLQK